MTSIIKVLRIIGIVAPLTAFTTISIMLLTKKYSFATHPILKWAFIILAVVIAIGIAYWIMKKLLKQKPSSGYKPLDVDRAKNALLTNLINNNIIRSIAIKNKIMPIYDDYEFGSQRTYWDKDGPRDIKKLDITIRLKGPNVPSHMIGTHFLTLPLTTESDIIHENVDYINRRFKLKPDRNRRDYPQSVERTPEERRIALLENYPIPDIEEVKMLQPTQEPEDIRLLRQMVLEQKALTQRMETKKPIEVGD